MGDPSSTLTHLRLAWLQKLEREGVAKRSRNNVGFACMRNGWTDWAVKMPDGSIRAWSSFEPGDPRRWKNENVGEMLTEAGRVRLAEHPAEITRLCEVKA